MQEKFIKPDFYPDINHFLESTDNAYSVSSKGMEELVFKVRALTGLDYDVSKSMVRYFFQEIRNSMLRGEIVTLRGLGRFLISSPAVSNNIRSVFPRFKLYRKFSRKLNE